MCSEQCSTSQDDKVLQEETVDSLRFCFFECKPAEGAAAPEESQCIAFTSAEAAHIVNPAGNAVDPAFLYSAATQPSFFNGQEPTVNQQPPPSFFDGQPPSGFSTGGQQVYEPPASAATLLSTQARLQKQKAFAHAKEQKFNAVSK
jgi:hypothetical protein